MCTFYLDTLAALSMYIYPVVYQFHESRPVSRAGVTIGSGLNVWEYTREASCAMGP